jgi:hypothetical protein
MGTKRGQATLGSWGAGEHGGMAREGWRPIEDSRSSFEETGSTKPICSGDETYGVARWITGKDEAV